MDLFDTWLSWILFPALAMALVVQLLVHYVLVRSESIKMRMSGYAVARHILDGAGKYSVVVEQVPGQLSDHYDARRNVLQLSEEVFHGRHVAALAQAAHEACHALQHERNMGLLLRDMAVPAASLGSGGGMLIALVGLLCRFPPLLALGIVMFSVTFYVQLLSLPIELHASWLAQRRLVALGIIGPAELPSVRRALWAVACSSLGATLQGVLVVVQRFIALWNRPRREG